MNFRLWYLLAAGLRRDDYGAEQEGGDHGC